MARVLFILSSILAIFAPVMHAAEPGVGPGYEIDMAYPFKTFIRKISLSLKVPATPNPQKNLVNIYPSLIALYKYHQPTLSSYGTPSSYQCSAAPGQWCAYSTVFDYNAHSITSKGSVAVVKPGDILQYSIELVGDGSGNYLETISRGGVVLSQTKDGSTELPIIFSLRSECSLNAANLPAYTYSDVTISLALAYPNYVKEASIQKNGVTTSPTAPYTSDGGLTWKLDSVNVAAALCTV